MRNCILAVTVLALVLAVSLPARGEPSPKMEVGVSLVISPDYNEVLTDAYSEDDVSGGYGWLGLSLGVRIPVAETVAITPRAGLLFNYVSGIGTESYANTIIVPAVAGRVLFTKGSSVFVEGEVNYNIPNTGAERFEFKSGGVGGAATIGYQWEQGMEIGIGYSYLPVDVTHVDGHYDSWSTVKETKNMGGAEIRFKFCF